MQIFEGPLGACDEDVFFYVRVILLKDHWGKHKYINTNTQTQILNTHTNTQTGACDADGWGKHVGCYKCGWKHQPTVSGISSIPLIFGN